MRVNTNDRTIERNYIQKYRFLVKEYELVKNKKHHKHKTVHEFYEANDLCRQTFLKYYARYKQSGKEEDLLPKKRGPKWKTRRPLRFIENKVIELRQHGINRYEIFRLLKLSLKHLTPSPSGIYNIFKRNNLNKLTPKMKQNKRKIIKKKAGEMGHIDCHYLSKDLIVNSRKRYYLVCVVDDATRVAWAEVVEDILSLTVMFTVLKIFNFIKQEFNIQFSEVLTDNGPEFGQRYSKSKYKHPFERMLMELGIKHRYTRPYRPQTNGKVERIWRTIENEMIEGTTFESIGHFKKELMQYLVYYNFQRPHQSLNGKSPDEFNRKLSTKY